MYLWTDNIYSTVIICTFSIAPIGSRLQSVLPYGVLHRVHFEVRSFEYSLLSLLLLLNNKMRDDRYTGQLHYHTLKSLVKHHPPQR